MTSASKKPHAVRLTALAALAAALLGGCATPDAPDAMATLRRAEQAMGGAALRSIAFTGTGSGGTFGQAYQASLAWPGLNYSVLSRAVDYENAAMREEFARSRSEPNGGGAVPLMGLGEQRATGFVRGEHAWNVVNNTPAAAPLTLPARMHDLWTTPHGVLKAAMRHQPRASTRSDAGVGYTVVSFTAAGQFAADVWIDPAGLVARIDSQMPHPVTGDTATTTLYSDYRDVGDGVRFPQRMRQTQGGHPVFDLRLADVKPNAPLAAALPDSVRDFAERVVASVVAPGVWYLAGGSHHSVLIEMQDHLVVVEAPLYDGRSAVMLAEAKRLVPGKPVRFVINSHHHFDHAGGLRAAVAEGATLITSAAAKPYFERVFANPNRIRPDLMARSGRSAQIIGVAGKHVLTDGSRSVEVHEIEGSVHATGFLMVWLPRERLLVQADAYTPGAAGAPPPPVPNANSVGLVRNIERLGMDVDRILPLHGRVVPMSELLAAIGRR